MQQTWLIIERFDNWQVDSANKFAFFGISSRSENTARKVAKDDLLICYVSSGMSAFSDVRRVRETGIKSLRVYTDYDTALPSCILTEPFIVLDRENWLPAKEVIRHLALTKEHKDWRQLFRTTIRALSEADAHYLLKALQARQRT